MNLHVGSEQSLNFIEGFSDPAMQCRIFGYVPFPLLFI
jgi:hypothetical protein